MFRKYPGLKEVWHWEEVAVIIFCASLSFGNLGIVFGLFTFAKIFMIFGFLYWLVRAFFRKDSFLFLLPFKSWTSLAIIVFFIAFYLSLFNITDYKYVKTGVIRIITLYLVVIWIAVIIRDKKHILYWLLIAVALSSAPNALGGIYELVTHKQILKKRASGTIEAQTLSRMTGGGTELAGGEGSRRCLSLQGGSGENSIHSVVYASISALLPFLTKNLWLRLLALLLVGINTINIVATGSRTGMIGLNMAFLVFLYFIEMRRKWLVVLCAIVGFFLAATIFDFPLKRLFFQSATSRGTIEVRILQWQTAWTMFERHPILGVGPGNFLTEYHRYHYDYPHHDKVLLVGPLHNAILNQATEGGLVGLFALLLLLTVVILKLYIVRAKSPDPYLRLAATSIMAGFVGWSGALLFYPSFLDEQGWILMGIAIGIWNIHQKTMRELSIQKGLQAI